MLVCSPPSYQLLRDAYVEWMRQRQNCADGTLDLRSRSIGKFLEWLGHKQRLWGFRSLLPIVWSSSSSHMLSTPGLRRAAQMQAALRTFLRFALHAGLIREHFDLAVPTLRTYKLSNVPRGLSEIQASQVLASVDRSCLAGRRDYAILQLLCSYGVRGGQVRGLRLSDIHWAQDRIWFRASKHGKDSLLPLTAEWGPACWTTCKTPVVWRLA